MKDYYLEHELNRQKLWSEAWTAVASANDCKSYEIATLWADKALKAFDERFKVIKN